MTSQLTASERIRQALARLSDLLGEYDSTAGLDPAKGPYTSPTGNKKIDAEFAEITAIANEIDTENNEDIEAVERGSWKSLSEFEDSGESAQISYAVDMLGIIARELRWIRISNELPK